MIERLPGPAKRYLLGARPSHSSRARLASHFQGVTPEVAEAVLAGAGLVDPETGKVLRKAAETGVVQSCDGKLLWNVDAVAGVMRQAGMSPVRQAVNQELAPPPAGDPRWTGLSAIGTHFAVSGTVTGRWLDELGLREGGRATKCAIDSGLAQRAEMKSGPGKNQTREIDMWNLDAVKRLLVEHGHELDFDYEATLKGRGRNSSVQVSGMDERAAEFARAFTAAYRDPAQRSRLPQLVKRQPKAILEKAEVLLRQPGLLTTGRYLTLIRR